MRTPYRFFIAFFVFAACASASDAQLRIVYPNGGESFRVGSRMTIQWAGVPGTDIVTLEYSTDNGGTWNLITNSATGLQYTWLNIPNAVSTNCLIRATTTTTVTPGTLSLFGNGNYGNADFSSDGNLVLGASADGYTYIWDSHSAQVLQKFQTETGAGVPGLQSLNFWGMFSPDRKTFATVSPSTDVSPPGNRVRVFDASTGVKLHEWHLYDPSGVAHTFGHCAFSPDGKHLAATGIDSIYVYDIATEAIVAKLAGFVRQEQNGAEYNLASTIDWNSNGSDIIGGIAQKSDSVPTYVRANATTGDTIQTYYLKTKYPFFTVHGGVHCSPDGTKFIGSTQDTAVRVWDVAAGNILYKIVPGLRESVDAVFSHDGKTIATIGYDSLGQNSFNVKLWNATDGSFIRWVGSVGFASGSIEFSPDDSRILVSSSGENVIFQASQSGTESDVSDGSWSIVPNSGENIVVYTRNASANAGDLLDIPILIDDPGGAVAAGATHVTFQLQFNETLLAPVLPSPLGTINGNDRVLSYSLPIVATDTILGILHAQAALGDDSQTVIQVAGPVTDAPAVTATDTSGVFKLLNLCNAGGTRLVNPNGVVNMTIPNNPVGDAIQVDMKLIEDGTTNLSVFDATGRHVITAFDEDVTHGARSISIPAKGLPSGMYYVVLRTPNHRLVEPVEVRH